MAPNSTPASRILVVDDCEPLRYLKTQFLLEAGFHVSQADTGRSALLSVETDRPDLVLLDVNLPDIHGSEVCREVKNRWGLPVIYTSSIDIPEELSGTADACLVSLDQQVLLEVVRTTLDTRSRPGPQPKSSPPQSNQDIVCAERSAPDDIAAQASIFQSGPLKAVLDNSPALLVILNRNREIVFCNRAALNLAGVSLPAVSGARFGEPFHCVHAAQAGGCGADEYCRTCEMMLAGSDPPGENAVSRKWLMVCTATGVNEACDLMVTASPLDGPDRFIVCTLADFSNEKRRQVIERLFFHDILNTAAAVEGCAALLRDELSGGAGSELAKLVDQCASELLSELRGQQLLSKAADGRLSFTPKTVGTLELVRAVAAIFRGYSLSKDRTILVDPLCADLRMETDPVALSRVLTNMLKSAVVATPTGGTVSIGCDANEGWIDFWVRDPGVIPQTAQPRIFQSSPSPKDGSLGLNTYSMKLLTERLGGTVRFESGPLHGTLFVAHLPLAFTCGVAVASSNPDPPDNSGGYPPLV